MRLNRLSLSVLAFSCVLFLFCGDGERSDVITGAGGGVINDMDPTLTDMKNGFSLVTLGEKEIRSGFSIPQYGACINFSTQSAVWFMAGVNDEGDTIRANMQFRVPSGTTRFDSDDEPAGAYLYFRNTGSDITETAPINIFSSDPSAEITPIKGGAAGDDEPVAAFESFGRIDSVKLDDALAKKIFDTRLSKSADTLGFAFSILDYYERVRKIDNPYVILRVARANGRAARDSIPASFTYFTAFENRDKVDERLDSLYSSQHTLRTAVFKIDISNIIKASELSEVINATISFEDDKKGAVRDQYKVVISDVLLLEEHTNSVDSVNFVQKRFRDAVSHTLDPKGNVHSIKNVVRSAIDNTKSELYVYLRPTSDHSVIIWDKESTKIEAVFTPSRSR